MLTGSSDTSRTSALMAPVDKNPEDRKNILVCWYPLIPRGERPPTELNRYWRFCPSARALRPSQRQSISSEGPADGGRAVPAPATRGQTSPSWTYDVGGSSSWWRPPHGLGACRGAVASPWPAPAGLRHTWPAGRSGGPCTTGERTLRSRRLRFEPLETYVHL